MSARSRRSPPALRSSRFSPPSSSSSAWASASVAPCFWTWPLAFAGQLLVALDSRSSLRAGRSRARRGDPRPRKTIPKTIVRAVVVSGLGGALLIVATLVSAPSLTDGKLATGGIAWAAHRAARPGFRPPHPDRRGRSPCSPAPSRCRLRARGCSDSMARERSLPVLARARARCRRAAAPRSPPASRSASAQRWHSPSIFGQSAIFTALSSLCIAMLYIAYLGVTAPLLVTRLRRRVPGCPAASTVPASGRSRSAAGSPSSTSSPVVYQVGMIINLAWPRRVYDHQNTWWLHDGAQCSSSEPLSSSASWCTCATGRGRRHPARSPAGDGGGAHRRRRDRGRPHPDGRGERDGVFLELRVLVADGRCTVRRAPSGSVAPVAAERDVGLGHPARDERAPQAGDAALFADDEGVQAACGEVGSGCVGQRESAGHRV